MRKLILIEEDGTRKEINKGIILTAQEGQDSVSGSLQVVDMMPWEVVVVVNEAIENAQRQMEEVSGEQFSTYEELLLVSQLLMGAM